MIKNRESACISRQKRKEVSMSWLLFMTNTPSIVHCRGHSGVTIIFIALLGAKVANQTITDRNNSAPMD